VRQTRRELLEFLRERQRRHGESSIILVAESNMTYATLLPVRDTALSCGYWIFRLGIEGDAKAETFFVHGGCEPSTNINVDVDVRAGTSLVDGKAAGASLVDILRSPTNRAFHVWIVADEATTAGAIFQVLRTCNACDRTTAFIIDREVYTAIQEPDGLRR
jgi:hypothetical protein